MVGLWISDNSIGNLRLKIVLDTKLSPEECAERLRSAIDPSVEDFAFPGKRLVQGTVKGSKFRIRKRIWGYDAWQRVLTGEFDASGARTRIYAKSHKFIAGTLANVIFLVLFVVPVVIALIESLMSGSYQSWRLSAIFVVVVVLLFIAIPLFDRRADGQSQIRFLENFLKETLEAKSNSGTSDFPKRHWFYPFGIFIS